MTQDSAKLILVRHGESKFNALNQFTGSVDVSLTDHGKQQAVHCSHILQGIRIDHVAHSQQKRAIDTCQIITRGLGLTDFSQDDDARLNERDYGRLNGMNKTQAAELYGMQQVKDWRRSFYACPPEGESLAQTANRAHDYFQESLAPMLKKYHNTLVVAHGNSIRGLLYKLLQLTHTNICQVEVGWCEPWVITFRANKPARLDIYLRENSGKQSSIPESATSIPIATHRLQAPTEDEASDWGDLISCV
jgi:2,3-bisphosphoglycerate-dependent phosphoglycerate mutase